MQLAVITSDNNIPNELAIINELFTGGLERLHVRKPTFTRQDYSAYLNGIHGRFRNRLVLHGFFDLYDHFGLGGAHLNSMMRNDPDIRRLIENINPSAVSTSFHSWTEIEENEFPYGYVFISPVFDSISKRDYKGTIDLEGAAVTRSKLQASGKYCPAIFGLGGVDKENIPVLQQHQFDGAALLGAIWLTARPAEAFAEIKSALNKVGDA